MVEKNTVYLAIALVIIIGAIFIIESANPSQNAPASPGQAQNNSGDFSPYPKAPELAGITGYINAPENLTIASLKGKVVLVDFWTYSCINCIRTLPYLESWDEKYSKDGLVIIGVHTPEFDFEKNYANVKAAVEKFGIKYPVVLDSDHGTWNAYQNQYWPRDYLIDANGRIRSDHIGEGGYEETEQEIVSLLSEAKKQKVEMNNTAANAPQVDFGKIQSPEIYLGDSYRRAPLGNAEPSFEGQELDGTIPNGGLSKNIVYIEGKWANGYDALKLSGDRGAVELEFDAKNVNIVAGSQGGTNLTVYLDGQRMDCDDSKTQVCAVKEKRLYSIVDLPGYGMRRLRIEGQGKGLELYTFTFG